MKLKIKFQLILVELSSLFWLNFTFQFVVNEHKIPSTHLIIWWKQIKMSALCSCKQQIHSLRSRLGFEVVASCKWEKAIKYFTANSLYIHNLPTKKLLGTIPKNYYYFATLLPHPHWLNVFRHNIKPQLKRKYIHKNYMLVRNDYMKMYKWYM